MLAALVLLVVAVGWYLAGGDVVPTAPVSGEMQTESAPAPGVSIPQPTLPIASPVVTPPGGQSPATTAVVAPPSASAPGPMVQPFQTGPSAARSAVPPSMLSQAAAPAPPAPSTVGPPAANSVDAMEAAVLDMDKARLMLRDYRSIMGTNPVGTNAEIMKAIMGGNARGAMLGPPEGQSLNANGELVDRWGTPYFFHQMTATHMEIHSAGPDRVFATADDVIQR